jgi:hypothetical protein
LLNDGLRSSQASLLTNRKNPQRLKKGTCLNALFWDRIVTRAEHQVGLISSQRTLDNSFDAVRAIRRGNTGFQRTELGLNGKLFDIALGSADYSSDSRTSEVRQAARNALFLRGGEVLKYIRSIRTGFISVSDPELGISESPLGDATLLPVLKMSELRYLDGWTKMLIGYTPTHSGYQFLQEAYQNGEWNGETPLSQTIRRTRRLPEQEGPAARPGSRCLHFLPPGGGRFY